MPDWPQWSKDVEQFNRTILITIIIAKIERMDWKTELKSFFSNTAQFLHTVSRVPPSNLLMNHELSNRLPNFTLVIRKIYVLHKLKCDITKEKDHEIKVVDPVLCKELHKTSKSDSSFKNQTYVVFEKRNNENNFSAQLRWGMWLVWKDLGVTYHLYSITAAFWMRIISRLKKISKNYHPTTRLCNIQSTLSVFKQIQIP